MGRGFCGGGFEVPTDGIVALHFHHIAQFAQFCAQSLQAVGLFDTQGAKPCDAEGAPHQAQHHHEGLRNVGGAAQIGKSGATAAHAAIASQVEVASTPIPRHTHLRHQFGYAAIALQTLWLEPFERDARLWHNGLHRPPVTRCAPVGFHREIERGVFTCRHVYHILAPLGFHSVASHQRKRHIYVGARHDFALYRERDATNHRSYQQNSGDVLRTHTSAHRQRTTVKACASDFQRRIALSLHIFNVGTQLAQRIYQHPDRPLAHTLRAVDHHFPTLASGKICREKTHRSASRTDVHLRGIGLSQRRKHRIGVVALRKVREPAWRSAKRIQQQHTIADTLRSRQINLALNPPRRNNTIIHTHKVTNFSPTSIRFQKLDVIN